MVIPIFMVWEIVVVLDKVKISKADNKVENATGELQ